MQNSILTDCSYTFKPVQTATELLHIAALQHENQRRNLSQSERQQYGFISADYNFDVLIQMHMAEPSLISKSNDQLIAYCLAFPPHLLKKIPALQYMSRILNQVDYQGMPLSMFHYLFVGQVCIAKEFRGQGIFDDLYSIYKTAYSSRYDMAVTAIPKENLRSMRAHQRVGFQEICTFDHSFDPWSLVLCDWR
ncbi:GNAT family N-acetyltransferase [Rhodocytophaga rosea]|uniref:GNAT family N-acetyltransferase n=1 Tax=Rhodocytophaga rosea TaxID=2704465 RepID=A0A6C0GJ62_9BACT|nr:GNAT family N-acetyltransferase [Rhodocytophaga rosea]QHT68068.1 GNAT family N-acetyltransferase [Rhodocytophaga rosea]